MAAPDTTHGTTRFVLEYNGKSDYTDFSSSSTDEEIASAAEMYQKFTLATLTEAYKRPAWQEVDLEG